MGNSAEPRAVPAEETTGQVLPRQQEGSPVPEPPMPGGPSSLSPSRAADFMRCPLLYRFRVIDRLPERPSAAAARGTVVHAVLERLFESPAAQRSVPRARGMVAGEWERLLAKRPELAELFARDTEDGAELARWLTEAESLVEKWFTLEDPTRLEPAERELFVETRLESGLRLRGIIDRVDIAPDGQVRIVDYKTGKAPRPEYSGEALFQMKFYALVLWRLRNRVPTRLQLVYLGSGDVLTYDPNESDLLSVERKLLALWSAIQQATETGEWRPRRSRLCDWCDYQAHCPEYGGTPPPYPLTLQPKLPLDIECHGSTPAAGGDSAASETSGAAPEAGSREGGGAKPGGAGTGFGTGAGDGDAPAGAGSAGASPRT